MYDSIFQFSRDWEKLERVWPLICLDIVWGQRRTCEIWWFSRTILDSSPSWCSKRGHLGARSIRDSDRPNILEMMSLCTNKKLRGVNRDQNRSNWIRLRYASFLDISSIPFRTSMRLHLLWSRVRYHNPLLSRKDNFWNLNIGTKQNGLPSRCGIRICEYMNTLPILFRYLDPWILHYTKMQYGAWKAAHP